MDADAIAALVRAFGVTIALSIVGIGLLVALGVVAIRTYVERWARQSLDKELETHRHRLQIEADTMRADLDRQIRDFTIYSKERHRAYAGMYKRLLVAEGAISNLHGLTFERTYEDATREEVQALLNEKKIPFKTQDEVLRVWDDSAILNQEGPKRLSEVLRQWKQNLANYKLTLARNYQLLNELYFSDEAREAIERGYRSLTEYWSLAMDADDRDARRELPSKKASSQAEMVKVRDLLRRELQRGDYAQARAEKLSLAQTNQ